MGKVKFGAGGLKLQAQLPKPASSLAEQVANLDMGELVKKLAALMPQPEPQKEVVASMKEVDLTPIHQKLVDMDQKLVHVHNTLDEKIDELAVRMDEDRQELELPIVNQVTHVKDTSPEVLNKCKEMLKYSEEAMMLKIVDLQRKQKRQVKLNYILSGLLIVNLFLHLI